MKPKRDIPPLTGKQKRKTPRPRFLKFPRVIFVQGVMAFTCFATMTDEWQAEQMKPKPDLRFAKAQTVELPSVALPPDDCGACSTNPAIINPSFKQRLSFDVPIRITNGITRFIVASNWPSGGEAARVRVPEPYGKIPLIGLTTNGGLVYWDVKGYSNIVQIVPMVLTNDAPMKFLSIWGANQ